MKKASILSRLLCGVFAVFLTVISCIPAFASVEEPGYVRTVFNRDNGLPTNEANVVIQTDDGYLWVGSYGGLLRYDGTSFRNFSAEGAIATPSIRVLFQDSVGRLWIGSSDAGVFVYENYTFTAVPCSENSGFLSIRDFAEDSRGTIYVATSSGVCEIRDGLLTPLTDPQVMGETALNLGIDPYDRLWCALSNGSCAVLRDGRCVGTLTADLFFEGGRKITCLTSDNDRSLYLGTDGTALAGVTCTGAALDASCFSVRIFDASDAAIHNRIGVTDDGSILVCGEQGFAYLTPDGTPIDPHTPGRTDAVNWATVDYEGNVWLATSNEGLVRYNPGCFASPNSEAGLTGRSINAVAAADGCYYAATDTGLLAFDADWHPIRSAVTDLLGATSVRHLMVDSRGRLWCGTYSDYGVVRYDPADGSIVSFNTGNGLDSTHVQVSYEMTDGSVAVGTQDGLALIRGDAVTAFYDKDDGMETQSILCIIEAPDGTLLAGSAGSGIYAIHTDGTITTYGHEAGLSDGVVLRILKEEGSESAFVSAGSHLYHWAGDTFRRLDDLEAGAGSIFDLREQDGRLWLMQDGGIYAVNKTRLLAGEHPHATKYGTASGLTGALSMNTWHYTAPDGRLYLATKNGISIFDFRDKRSNGLPRLVIDSIRVDDAVYESPTQVKLSKNNRRMTVNFSALTYSGAADLCLAYQLVGFAKNETVLSGATSGSVSYTSLDGGTYTFRLRVFDPDDPTVQETLQITIVKEKRLTEYPLTWIVCAVLLASAAFGITHVATRSRMKRLRGQRQMYKDLVGQALRTVANTVDAKDPYTNGHSIRVAIYAREITRRLGYSENDQESVYYIALLHDIGKIAVPDHILKKPGSLTPEERAVVQMHPPWGGEILRDFTALKYIDDGARYHHERYDGKGYCEGLAGEDIPLIGRIVCVADSYDAMASDRYYRGALSKEKILEEFERCSGTQFDPRIAAVMIDMIREGAVPVSGTTGREMPAEATSAPAAKPTKAPVSFDTAIPAEATAPAALTGERGADGGDKTAPHGE